MASSLPVEQPATAPSPTHIGLERRSPRSRLLLGQRFTLLLAMVYVATTVVTGLILGSVLQRRAEAQIVSQGELLANFEDSLRSYMSDQLLPQVPPEPDGQPGFEIQSVPTFAAKEVFSQIKQDQTYANFQYRVATLDPRSKSDTADAVEASYLARFQQAPGLAEISGYRTLNGQTMFYSARPIVVSDESCLVCHSTPEVAPPAMVALYGTEGGFSWQLGSTVGTQIVYVPASDVLNSAHQSLALIMGIFVLVFALVIILINLLLRRLVVTPIHTMSSLAARISHGEMSAEGAGPNIESLDAVAARGDELGESARVLQQMAREIYERERRLREEVHELRIVIDQSKKESQVKEITDSDFFRDLENRAHRMRQTRDEGNSG